jgi:hypothetical protein
MDTVAALVILGTAMGIGAMALVAWAGAIFLQRVLGHDGLVPSEEPSARSGPGKHRPP